MLSFLINNKVCLLPIYLDFISSLFFFFFFLPISFQLLHLLIHMSAFLTQLACCFVATRSHLKLFGFKGGQPPSPLLYLCMCSVWWNNSFLLSVKAVKGVNEEAFYRGMRKIGSSPPSCEHKCYGCIPCEAIQVPTTNRRSHVGVQYTNYEPEGWKCKCGPSFYSPWF